MDLVKSNEGNKKKIDKKKLMKEKNKFIKEHANVIMK